MTRIEELEGKLAASEKLPDYERRCKEIRAEIKRLKEAGLVYDL